jgi:hypothetical protein
MDVMNVENLTNWANANLVGQARLDLEKSKAKYVSSSIVIENWAILWGTGHSALILRKCQGSLVAIHSLNLL